MKPSVLILAAAAALAAGACTNPSTPEGHEGYVYNIPLVFGRAEYRDSVRGPSSTGASWRLYVKNVDMRAKSYKEEFQLLTRDNLSVEFEVNTRISLRPKSVKVVVEEWGESKWYEWNVREQLRTMVRRAVTQVSAIDIQLKTDSVRAQIEARLLEKFQNTPVHIESVDIGNIRFPREVTTAIEAKIGQQQELERQEYLLAKTQKEAAIRVLEALKAAKQQVIISSTLDPLYVQRMAVQAYRLLAKTSNKVVVVLPNSDEGTGMPLVLSTGKRKLLTPADERMLAEMETRYMKMAGAGASAAPPSGPAEATPAPVDDAVAPAEPVAPAAQVEPSPPAP